MTRYEIDSFKLLIEKLRICEGDPYSSNPEYEDGFDVGRDNSADELEWLLDELVERTKNE